MTEIAPTPEEFRRVATWLEETGFADDVPDQLRDKADRLEARDMTPERVACEAEATWQCETAHTVGRMQFITDAVIAHVVGPDRVVVERGMVNLVLNMDQINVTSWDHFRAVMAPPEDVVACTARIATAGPFQDCLRPQGHTGDHLSKESL